MMIVPTQVQNWLQALLFYWTTLYRIIWLCVPYSSKWPLDEDFDKIGPLLVRSAIRSRRRWLRRRHINIFRQLHNIRVKNRNYRDWKQSARQRYYIKIEYRIAGKWSRSFCISRVFIEFMQIYIFPCQIIYLTSCAIEWLFAQPCSLDKCSVRLRMNYYSDTFNVRFMII